MDESLGAAAEAKQGDGLPTSNLPVIKRSNDGEYTVPVKLARCQRSAKHAITAGQKTVSAMGVGDKTWLKPISGQYFWIALAANRCASNLLSGAVALAPDSLGNRLGCGRLQGVSHQLHLVEKLVIRDHVDVFAGVAEDFKASIFIRILWLATCQDDASDHIGF